MRRALSLLLVIALSGCGTYVHIYQIAAPDAVVKERVMRMRRMYVWVKEQTESASTVQKKRSELGRTPFSETSVIESINQALNSHGANVVAYRVVNQFPAADVYIPSLEPTAVAYLEYEPVESRSAVEKIKDEEWVEDKDKRRIRKAPVYRKTIHARFRFHIRVLDYPENRVALDRWDEVVYESQTTSTSPLPESVTSALPILRSGAAERVAEWVAPTRSIEHKKPLWAGEKESTTAKALALYKDEKYDEAKALWTQDCESSQTTPSQWISCYNVAVLTERVAEREKAAQLYQRAQTLGAADKKSQTIKWKYLLKPLSELRIANIGLNERDAPWFSQTTAVLPFSDETTSIDGPVQLRQMTYQKLKAGGYRLLSLERVDELLRQNGFTQGGQLQRVQPEKIARWLGVERLMYGHITDFQDVKLAIVGRRLVAGQLRLWDGKTGRDAWTNGRQASTFGIVPSLDPVVIGISFAAQLLYSFGELAFKRPLYAESVQFIQQTLQDLPMGFSPYHD